MSEAAAALLVFNKVKVIGQQIFRLGCINIYLILWVGPSKIPLQMRPNDQHKV